jgi:hypothetical protein
MGRDSGEVPMADARALSGKAKTASLQKNALIERRRERILPEWNSL